MKHAFFKVRIYVKHYVTGDIFVANRPFIKDSKEIVYFII